MARRIKTVTAGRMVYAVSYPIPRYTLDQTERQRGARRAATSQWRERLNRLKSCEKLEQLVFCNFRPGDHYITLTYRDECLPDVRREVLRDVKNFRRRLADRRGPRGQSCRYIYTPEHKTSGGRWHAHMILNRADASDLLDIAQCWICGHAHVEPVNYLDVEELASYLAKESPDYVGEHPWITSRGLLRPTVDSRLVANTARLAIPQGAVVKRRDATQNEYGDFEFLKYYLPA